MLKRLVVAMVGLVGVVVIALGIASATLWRADDVLVAQLQADEHLVVTDPGVLELADAKVTVRVEADGPVVLAVGRDTDVLGWVGDDAHQRVTGLSGWHELAARSVEAAPTPTPTADPTAPADPAAPPADPAAPPVEGEAPAEGDAGAGDDAATPEAPAPTAPDPTGSDLWITQDAGDGEAEITWTAQPGRWSLVAASIAGAPPRLTLSWPQVVTTPWLWPCVVVGALLVLAAAGLLLRDVLRARRSGDAGWTPVLTGPVPVVGADGATVQLTRRQLRELAAHGAVSETGVRTPRDGAPSEGAPAGDAPTETLAPVADVGRPPWRPEAGPDTPVEVDEPAAAAGRGAGAFAALAPATRRAMRSVTSFGAGARADEPAPAPEPGRPAPSAPTGRPAPAAPPPGAAPVPGARPAGAPRWTVGGAGPAPWAPSPAPASSGPVAPGGGTDATAAPVGAAPVSQAAGARVAAEGRGPAGPGHPQGRPAWLGPAPGAAGRPAGGSPLPAPGAPGSPDAGRRPAPAPAGPAAPPPAPATRPQPGSDRPGWVPVPPAPGPVAGRSAGPDAPRGPVPARPGTAPVGQNVPRPAPGAPVAPDEAPRPAWLRDAPVPSGPRSSGAAEPPGGSRADAWRRAWGLAATDDDQTTEDGR